MTAPARLFLKRILAKAYRLRNQSGSRRIVLLYHSIGNSPFALAAHKFREQIAWLADNAEILPLQKLLANVSHAPLQAAVTFDDGYASIHQSGLSILSDTGVVAAAFLNTGWIGTSARKSSDSVLGHYPYEEFLLWREVEDLAARGWEIGSHGVNHLDLTAEPDDIVTRELCESRARIDKALSTCSPVFSYTWGRHTAHLRRVVENVGYTHAVAGLHRPVTIDADRMAIPRINITNDYTLDDFKAVARGDWDYLGWVQSVKASVSALKLR